MSNNNNGDFMLGGDQDELMQRILRARERQLRSTGQGSANPDSTSAGAKKVTSPLAGENEFIIGESEAERQMRLAAQQAAAAPKAPAAPAPEYFDDTPDADDEVVIGETPAEKRRRLMQEELLDNLDDSDDDMVIGETTEDMLRRAAAPNDDDMDLPFEDITAEVVGEVYENVENSVENVENLTEAVADVESSVETVAETVEEAIEEPVKEAPIVEEVSEIEEPSAEEAPAVEEAPEIDEPVAEETPALEEAPDIDAPEAETVAEEVEEAPEIEKPAAEVAPVAEEAPEIDKPVAEETPAVEETPAAEEAPVASAVTEQPAIVEEKPAAPVKKKSDSNLPVPVIPPRDLSVARAAKKQANEYSFGSDSTDSFKKAFLVSASPHIHSGETTRVIMGDVLFALLPAAIVSWVYFGWRALLLTVICVASCVITEAVCRIIMKRRQTIGDLSAAVTGVLLAFCLPPEINPLFAVIGSVVAIAVVKQMFGGIGMNFANPAATARIVLMLSFPVAMTTYTQPFAWWDKATYDGISTATPLAGGVGSATNLELLLGFHSGCLGETCAIALIVGGLFLLMRGIITWEIPVTFMGTVMLFALVTGENPIYHLLSGGVMLGAIFMATDYSTSPINRNGKLIYGVGCGLLTMLIRLYGSMAEGVSFAILLMNIITPLIDRVTLPRAFGEERDAA